MSTGIFVGNKEIKGVYIGSKQVLGVYAGSVQIWPNEQWTVESVTITIVREEVLVIAPVKGGEASTKVYFKAIEHQKSNKGESRDVETEQEIDVKYTFDENTTEEERDENASAVYTDVLGNPHAINGTVKQEKLVWELKKYFVDYGESVPVTYAPYGGGEGTSTVEITIFAHYESNAEKTKDEKVHTDTVTLSHTFESTESESIVEYETSATYRHDTYGTFTITGKVYQNAMSAITILPITVPDISAAGGGYNKLYVSYVYEGTTFSKTVQFTAVTAGRIPAEERSRTLIDTRTLKIEHEGASASQTVSFYQEANKLEKTEMSIVDKASTTYSSTLSDFNVTASYSKIPAKGGSSSPTVTWSCKESLKTTTISETYYDKYVYTSGAYELGDTLHGGSKSESTSTNTLNNSSHAGYDVSYTYEGDDTDETTGMVTAESLGKTDTTKDNTVTNVDVYVKLTGSGSLGSGQGHDSVYVYQEANTYEDERTEWFSALWIVDGADRNIGNLSASATTVFARCIKGVRNVRTYKSGETTTLSDTAERMSSGVSISTPRWIKTQSSGGGYAYNPSVGGFVLDVSKNETGDRRSGDVRVTALGETKSFTVTQLAE